MDIRDRDDIICMENYKEFPSLNMGQKSNQSTKNAYQGVSYDNPNLHKVISIHEKTSPYNYKKVS